MVYSRDDDTSIVEEYIAAQQVLRLGVVPRETYTTSSIASIINSTMRNNDFVNIIIKAGTNSNWLTRDVIITGIIDQDQFSVQSGAVYNRPLTGESESLIGQYAGNIQKAAGKFSKTASQATGQGIYSPYQYIPTYQSPEASTYRYSISFKLYATSNPINQVELPASVLYKLQLPAQTKNNVAAFPGPRLNLQQVAQTTTESVLNSDTISQGIGNLGNLDISQALDFSGSFNVSIVLGDLAIFDSVIITSFNATFPNRKTTNYHGVGGVPTFGVGTEKYLGYSCYGEANCTLNFELVVPPVINETCDFQGMSLFPNKNYKV